MKFVEIIMLAISLIINDKISKMYYIEGFNLFDERCKTFVDLCDKFSCNKNKNTKYLVYMLTNTIKSLIIKRTQIIDVNKIYNNNVNITFAEYEILYNSVNSFVEYLDTTFNHPSSIIAKINNESDNESDNESNNSEESNNSIKSDYSDKEDNKYMTDDEPEVIYTKAIINASRKTKKIMNCVKND
jgi:hypothetical protein